METRNLNLFDVAVKDEHGRYSFNRPIDEDILIAVAGKVLENRIKRGEVLIKPNDARRYFQLRLGSSEREVFACAWLDSRHRVIEFDELFFGTIDGATVHPREVVKAALLRNAAAVIVVHNHPSGDAEPSEADEAITSRLKDALALIDVRVLDHIIVSATDTCSMAERGKM